MRLLQTLAGAFMGEAVNPDPTTYWAAAGQDFPTYASASNYAQRSADRTGRVVAVYEHAPGLYAYLMHECYPREQTVTYALDPL